MTSASLALGKMDVMFATEELKQRGKSDFTALNTFCLQLLDRKVDYANIIHEIICNTSYFLNIKST